MLNKSINQEPEPYLESDVIDDNKSEDYEDTSWTKQNNTISQSLTPNSNSNADTSAETLAQFGKK